ncbi:MAG: hypothetical protein AVDCRST_MAG21-1030, partial [uncultured Nocardioidaceae bacterium]
DVRPEASLVRGQNLVGAGRADHSRPVRTTGGPITTELRV